MYVIIYITRVFKENRWLELIFDELVVFTEFSLIF